MGIRRIFMMAGLMVGLLGTSARGDLIAYWNFNELDINSASSPGFGDVPTSISATGGSGTLSLLGWTGTVDDFAGSTLNRLNTDTDPGGASLSLRGSAGNESYIEFQFSLTGFKDAIVTFATEGTSTGYTNSDWLWSTDGTNFLSTGIDTSTTTSSYELATVDLASTTLLNDASVVFLRYTLDGASSASGNNKIDNLQINATAVPETSTIALAAIGAIGGAIQLRRRKKAESC